MGWDALESPSWHVGDHPVMKMVPKWLLLHGVLPPAEPHSRPDDPQLLILRPTFYCPQSFCGLFSGWMWTNYHLLWLSGFISNFDCNQILPLYLYPAPNQALSFWSFKMGRLLGENLGQRQAVARRQATIWTLSFGTQKSSSNKAPQDLFNDWQMYWRSNRQT